MPPATAVRLSEVPFGQLKRSGTHSGTSSSNTDRLQGTVITTEDLSAALRAATLNTRDNKKTIPKVQPEDQEFTRVFRVSDEVKDDEKMYYQEKSQKHDLPTIIAESQGCSAEVSGPGEVSQEGVGVLFFSCSRCSSWQENSHATLNIATDCDFCRQGQGQGGYLSSSNGGDAGLLPPKPIYKTKGRALLRKPDRNLSSSIPTPFRSPFSCDSHYILSHVGQYEGTQKLLRPDKGNLRPSTGSLGH